MSSWEAREASYDAHTQPNGRPVHPACTLDPRSRVKTPCSCDKLWDGWDGTEAHLDQLIAENMRRESRRYAEATDELAGFLDDDARASWCGFWSNAENLRCTAGKDFLNGPLDMKRFKTSTWERALS